MEQDTIAKTIHQELVKKQPLVNHLVIDVECDDMVVRLTGMVPNFYVKQMIQVAIMDVLEKIKLNKELKNEINVNN
jgi:hypothetical protein